MSPCNSFNSTYHSVLLRLDRFCPTPLLIIVRVKMNKKQKFIQAVRILAPDNNFILELAHLVSDDDLPTCPGGAALEFVAALTRLTGNTCPRRATHRTMRCPISHTRTILRSRHVPRSTQHATPVCHSTASA